MKSLGITFFNHDSRPSSVYGKMKHSAYPSNTISSLGKIPDLLSAQEN